jgi:putative ABC transport system permease protein
MHEEKSVILDRIKKRWQALFRKEELERELEAELRFHLERDEAENLRSGMNSKDAQFAALKSFGGIEQAKEECRDARGVRAIEEFWQDLRFAVRTMRKHRGFTLTAVFTLALGIGANTAVFSVVNAVLLRDLPFPESDRIVTLWENNTVDGLERDDVSPANFLDWRERQKSFEELAFANPNSLDYVGDGEPVIFRAALVSKGFFEVLGATPLHGRVFAPEEYQAGKNKVVILSYGLWQRRFGGDPNIVGTKLTLDEEPMIVVGVMRSDFRLHLFDVDEEMWGPQVVTDNLKSQRKATYLKVIGRLKQGVTIEQAQAEMLGIGNNLASEYPATNSGIGVTAVTLPEHLKGKWRLALLILLGAVGFVLLIACTNVANLLLARGAERERELAIRAAMGAGCGRLLRQLLTESLLIAILGCGIGIMLASWCIHLIVAFNPGDIPRIEQVHIDGATLIFVTAVAFLATLVFGIAPALQFSRPNLQRSLKEAGHTVSSGSARQWLRGGLVITEIALAVVLLIGAGLLVRSFVSLINVDPGFSVDRVASLQVFIWRRYTTPEQRVAYVNETLSRIEAMPDVEAAGITTAIPILESSATTSVPLSIEGQPPGSPGQEPVAQNSVATGGYFRAIGARLLRGRLFNQFDTYSSLKVAVINDTMAKRYWPAEDPIGRKFSLRSGARGEQGPITLEIAGVVSDSRQDGLDKPTRPEFFRPHSQSPSGSLIYIVRARNDTAALIPAIRESIWKTSPGQPFYSVTTMDRLVSDSLKSRRFNLALLGAFAGLALILALTGVYGVMSFVTRQRTHELGVRVALGAGTRDIAKLVLGHGFRLAMIGTVIGAVAAFALTRLMSALLFGVTASDPLTFAVVTVLLPAIALLACYLPARRAMKIDPLVALRYE